MSTRSTDALFVILGDQLFAPAHLRDGEAATHEGATIFMAEDVGLCTTVRHHRQKLVLFLAAMRAHRDALRDAGRTVHYESLDAGDDPTDDRSYEEKLAAYLDGTKSGGRIRRIVTWEIADRSFEARLRAFCAERELELTLLPSPMFVTPRAEAAAWLDDNRPFMASFYKWQRRRLDLLLDGDGDPVGGQWSFDEANRKALPRDVAIPAVPDVARDDHVDTVIDVVEALFPDHPGALDAASWWLPTTRSQALAWLRRFLSERFERFGPYEDALSTRGPVLFHSVLTPMLNTGLLTPAEVVERAVAHAAEHDVPIESLEGFVRQVVGWREFIHAIDRRFGEEQASRNTFDHRRRLAACWWSGETGLPPLDDVIRKVDRYGYAHHIERLMVAGNLMLLAEIDPDEAERWFMECFVDSAEWVMGPNVRGMALFSDEGIFATKPYICGSNYILKMSDYRKPRKGEPGLFADDDDDDDATWCDVMDGLYWRFIGLHREFLRTNARMAQMVATHDRMDEARRERIVGAAERWIERVTLPPT